MERREFIKKSCVAVAGAVAASSALYAVSSPGTLPGNEFTVVMKEKYYLDYEAFKIQFP